MVQKMKKLLIVFLVIIITGKAEGQEYFTIPQYDVTVTVNKDASLDVVEKIHVRFSEQRHGILRKIPFKYEIQPLPPGSQKADRQPESGGYTRTIIKNIKVAGWHYEVSTDGNYKSIKIGSADSYVSGDQLYVISYTILNAINFFKDHSELYFNVIGDQWNTTIDAVHFEVNLYQPLEDTSEYFVATGAYGSRENNTKTQWINNKTFSGNTTASLSPGQGVTIGISFPNGYLTKPDYFFWGIYWLVLPLLALGGMYYVWDKWGKDEKVTVQTEYYPPDNSSPSISGYIINDRLDRRDLTALVPYWGAGGYLKINETENSFFLGLIKTKEYEFIKLKNLPENAYQFEKTLFNGIFETGDTVKLSDLKNVLYKSMNQAKSELENEITLDNFYVKYSRGSRVLFAFCGIAFIVFGVSRIIIDQMANLWMGISLIASGIIIFIFGILMAKKTKKGTQLYQELLGFKEFIKSVEKDRLKEFLKQDPNYFDKVLPYAIVFDVADEWKDKLKGLDIPPPAWYSGYYAGNNFNTLMFMNSLDHSMKAMTNTFYSAPQGSGSSGGSFGGGGFSGGGFGGGGGSSW
jgi:uncharacterized membrane protein